MNNKKLLKKTTLYKQLASLYGARRTLAIIGGMGDYASQELMDRLTTTYKDCPELINVKNFEVWFNTEQGHIYWSAMEKKIMLRRHYRKHKLR